MENVCQVNTKLMQGVCRKASSSIFTGSRILVLAFLLTTRAPLGTLIDVDTGEAVLGQPQSWPANQDAFRQGHPLFCEEIMAAESSLP